MILIDWHWLTNIIESAWLNLTESGQNTNEILKLTDQINWNYPTECDLLKIDWSKLIYWKTKSDRLNLIDWNPLTVTDRLKNNELMLRGSYHVVQFHYLTQDVVPYFIWCHLISSDLIWSYPILSYSISSDIVRSPPISSCLITDLIW